VKRFADCVEGAGPDVPVDYPERCE